MASAAASSDSDAGPIRRDEAGPRDETELLAAYRGGERQAAEELVDRTYGAVYGALFRLTGGDADLAADLTQESYRRAWQALPRFEGRSRVSTWLYRIAYTTFLNHVRRPVRVVPFERDTRPPVAPQPADQLERATRADASGRLRRAVLALSEDLRFTVTARYWGELTVREIAGHQGVTPAAIRKRLGKALRLLADALEEEPR